MNRTGAFCCFLILGFASISLADPTGPKPTSGPGSSPENTLFGKLFGKKAPPPAPAAPGPRVNPREQAAKTVLIEQQAHLQRLAVCTRLRELADETGDESLNKKADDLEAKAYELYQQRISHLPSARELNRSAEKSLDRELGRGVETDPIRSDAKKPSKAEEKASAKREEKK